MEIISRGPQHISYRFASGEEKVIPAIPQDRMLKDYKFKMCSRCKKEGVFEYT